jgi:hypothetical protein
LYQVSELCKGNTNFCVSLQSFFDINQYQNKLVRPYKKNNKETNVKLLMLSNKPPPPPKKPKMYENCICCTSRSKKRLPPLPPQQLSSLLPPPPPPPPASPMRKFQPTAHHNMTHICIPTEILLHSINNTSSILHLCVEPPNQNNYEYVYDSNTTLSCEENDNEHTYEVPIDHHSTNTKTDSGSVYYDAECDVFYDAECNDDSLQEVVLTRNRCNKSDSRNIEKKKNFKQLPSLSSKKSSSSMLL